MRLYVKFPRLLFAALMLAAVSTASAGASVAETLANQQSLRASVESGQGKFARLKTAERTRLLRAQDTIFALLEGKSTVADLSRAELARIDAAETEIAKLVAALDPPAAKAKVKCSYEARIGSNRKERICRKVSGDTTQARETLQKMQAR